MTSEHIETHDTYYIDNLPSGIFIKSKKSPSGMRIVARFYDLDLAEEILHKLNSEPYRAYKDSSCE